MSLTLKAISGEFAVCQIASVNPADFAGDFVSISRTKDEISLVCAATSVPANALRVENGWKILKIDAALDFGLVGVLAGLSRILADAGIPIFVVSTFNTDYLLVKSAHHAQALRALEQGGHRIA